MNFEIQSSLMAHLSATRARVFLFPGTWHGSWCWTRHITPLLSKLKYECIPIDYPRKFYPDSPATFNDYVNYSTDIIEEKYDQDTSKPNVIVTHSLGGLIGTNVTEKVIKERNIDINGVIHVSSIVLLNGENIFDNQMMYKLNDLQSFMDSVNIIESKDGEHIWIELKQEHVESLFYHDCTKEDIDFAKKKLVAEIRFGKDVIANWSSKDGYNKVKKLYIERMHDRVIPIEIQREICNKLELKRDKYEVISMNTSHSPFFADPVTLTAHLDEWMRHIMDLKV